MADGAVGKGVAGKKFLGVGQGHGMACLLGLIGASFFLQPLDVRLPGGLPLAGSLICVYVLFSMPMIATTIFWPGGKGRWWPNMRMSSSFVLCVMAALWLVVDWRLNHGVAQGLAMAVFLLFLGIVCVTPWQKNQLALSWLTSLVACSLLVLVGLWRFLFGYHGEGTEYVGNFWRFLKEGYFPYFGISYTPSTRNADFLYLFLPFLFCLCLCLHATRMTVGKTAAVLLSLLPVVLSFCRGGWLALALGTGGLVLKCRKPRLMWAFLVTATAVVFILNLSLGGKLVPRLYEKAVSIVLPHAAAANAEQSNRTAETYSNAKRIQLLQEGLGQFLARPFGSGSTQASDAFGSESRPVHFENFFVDLFVVFGVFAFPLVVILFIAPLVHALRLPDGDSWIFSSMGVGCSMFLPVYCLFNSVMDFAFFWYLAALSDATVQAAAPGGLPTAQYNIIPKKKVG